MSKFKATVVSVGVNDAGRSVVRVQLWTTKGEREECGAMIEVDTNVASFAKLAAAGVPVFNGRITAAHRKEVA